LSNDSKCIIVWQPVFQAWFRNFHIRTDYATDMMGYCIEERFGKKTL